MANITERDIVDHLKEKIRFHQQEERRIENVLSAFTVAKTGVINREAKSAAQQESREPGNGKKKPGKPNALKAKENRPARALAVPESYSERLTLNEKIAFALKEIGTGYNEDIARTIAQYEPQSDEKKISTQISGVLSTLKSTGRLTAVKEGRKDRFSLPA